MYPRHAKGANPGDRQKVNYDTKDSKSGLWDNSTLFNLQNNCEERVSRAGSFILFLRISIGTMMMFELKMKLLEGPKVPE